MYIYFYRYKYINLDIYKIPQGTITFIFKTISQINFNVININTYTDIIMIRI